MQQQHRTTGPAASTCSTSAPRCSCCNGAGPLQRHHVASRTIAPDAVVELCRICHELLHARNASLWRGSRRDVDLVELMRLGLHRLAETLDFSRQQRPELFVDGSLLAGAVTAYFGLQQFVIAAASALDAIAETLIESEHEVTR